jgi:hypothetical protein
MNYKFLSVLALLTASTIYFLFRFPSEEKINAWKSAHPENAARIEAHCNPAAEKATTQPDGDPQ